MGTAQNYPSLDRTERIGSGFSFSSNGFCNCMDNLSGYAHRPLAFVLRYLRRRLASHVVILTAVVAAVACSVGTQYGVKFLVDGLSGGPARAGSVWLAFVFLMSLIAADNFLCGFAGSTTSVTLVVAPRAFWRARCAPFGRSCPGILSD